MSEIIGAEPIKNNSKVRKSRPKPTFEVTIHTGILRKNFRITVMAHEWWTAIHKAVRAYHNKTKTEMPKRLVISVRKK